MSSALTAAHASGGDRMQLVNEQPNVPLAGLHISQERLETLLQFAAVLGTRSQVNGSLSSTYADAFD
jgi:hypothetical protein